MTTYVAYPLKFSTEKRDGGELITEALGNKELVNRYYVVGSIPREINGEDPTKVLVHGVIFKGEYIGKQNFLEKIDKRIKKDSFLILKLCDEERKGFTSLETQDDLVITPPITDIQE